MGTISNLTGDIAPEGHGSKDSCIILSQNSLMKNEIQMVVKQEIEIYQQAASQDYKSQQVTKSHLLNSREIRMLIKQIKQSKHQLVCSRMAYHILEEHDSMPLLVEKLLHG